MTRRNLPVCSFVLVALGACGSSGTPPQLTGSGLAITTTTLPEATVGVAFSARIEATGGTSPYICSVVSSALPDGLSLSADGTLAGTPTTSGSFTFNVQVTDSSGTPQVAQATLGLTIDPNPANAVSITTDALPAATVGTAYQGHFVAAGGTTPYWWMVTAGTLPFGLTMSAAGDISGTPVSAGSFTFTVEVTDSSAPAATAAKQLTITVAAAPGQSLTIATTMLPQATAGTAYTETLIAAGGIAPYAFSMVDGALPPGLSLASDGTIAGTPTASGTYSFTLRATDSAVPAATADRTLWITVAAAAGQLAISTMALPAGRAGNAYSTTLAATNGTEPYHWAVTQGALPDGLSLSDAGVLSGTPSASGTYTFTVTVTDSAVSPGSASSQFYLFVF